MRIKLPRPYRSILLVALIMAFAGLPTTSIAWNRGAHLVTGALTYDELIKGDSALLASDVALLKAHPAREK